PRSYLPLHSFPTRRSSDLRLTREPELRYTTNDDGYEAMLPTIITTNMHLADIEDRRTLLVGWELPFVRVDGTTEERVEQVCAALDRKSTRLNSSHVKISYA